MDIRIQEVQSRVHATDSQKLLDPRVMKQIVQACVQAVKEDHAKEKRRKEERELSPGVAPDRQ